MNCIHCGEATEVYDSRKPYRRRQCTNGHRFKTLEVLATKKPSDPVKASTVHMIRTAYRIGQSPARIAERLGLPIEIIFWYLKDDLK
jgi:transcriptional regulator NrdR family protein